MPSKVTIYGSAACKEHERTPDMGCVPRMGGLVLPKVTIYGEGRVPGARKDPRYGTRTRDGAAGVSQSAAKCFFYVPFSEYSYYIRLLTG